MTSHFAAGLVLSLSAAAVVVPWLAGGESEIRGGAECQTSCGGVDIPFPFGMGPDDRCWLAPDFRITCDDVGGNGVKPFMMVTGPNSKYGDSDTNNASVEVLNISPEQAEVQVLHPLSYSCYDDAGNTSAEQWWSWDLSNTPYSLSSTANNFMVVGCWAQAYIDRRGNIENASATMDLSGCLSMCTPGFGGASVKPCSGVGCCQTDIPTGLQYYGVRFAAMMDRKEYGVARTCSVAVPMASSYFRSNLSSPKVTSKKIGEAFNTSLGGKAPVVLEWSIGQDDCSTARTKQGYACVSSHSLCNDATSGRGGYNCECSPGYKGNPYLPDGCQDIDECLVNNPCYFGDCKNTDGGFACYCPPGKTGNAYIRDGCQKDFFPPRARIATGILVGLFVALLIAFLSIQVFRYKESKKRQGYFEQHGGRMLLRMLETERNNNIAFTLYDRGDLVKATGDFHKDNIVGEGAHGTVYKAILGTATVAVKRCKQIDNSRTEEFVQELVVLCRASHPNIVRLLGCCFHFEAPMLVYEFVPNGTLSKLLHGRPRHRVTLPTRLRIAAETAEALAHLHSPPYPTLHGDIKPDNILLGKGWVAKVSDFGCSTINDNVQVVPKGTLAYLDPEFLKDQQITEKTDVYSFGVVLIELLTGKNPQDKEWKNLTMMFQYCMGNGTLGDLLDADIVEEGCMGLIHAAAKLVSQCIAAPGTARLAMGQLAVELRRFSDEMPESPEARAALYDEDGRYSYTATEGKTRRFSKLTALSTELAR